MNSLYLVRPELMHKEQYEAMMDEWEAFGGRINPGALRRYSNKQQKNVRYEEWLKWIDEDREILQDLYFLTDGNLLLGAISIRYECAGIDGHSGFGIRPSERRKGYATAMLNMALPIMKRHNINPIVISCAKENIGSAKTIISNGGKLAEEITENSGKTTQIYHITY